MPRGVCKMCQEEKELQRSHLIPKAVYKKSRSGDPKKPHPILLTTKGTRQSSYQVMDYVFCQKCEHLLCKNGEDYVMRLIHHGNTFPFLDLLNSHGPGLIGSEFRFYSQEMSPRVDRGKIAYFAASIFWRAAVHTWRQEDGKMISIDLSAEERESLRQYMLGNEGFPKSAGLLTYACTDMSSQRSFWMPGKNDRTKDRAFLLGLRGMTFFFAIGEAVPPLIAKYCMMNSPQRWITVRNCSLPRPIWELGDSPTAPRKPRT